MTAEEIIGVPVDNITYEDIMSDLPIYIQSNNKMTVISVNPQIIVGSNKYPDVVNFIKKATHRIPDGIGIVIVSKMTGGQIGERVTGYDLMVKFLEYANFNKKSCFFYGAKPDVLTDALINIQSLFPDLVIAGSIDGYTNKSNEEIIFEINQKEPDFLFIALGFPRQEQWLHQNLSKLDAKVFQDVGGSFDVLSGHVKRAPDFFIKNHLEWLYRSLSNPTRFYRILQLPIFVVKSLAWHIRMRK